ncbi:hypothetical protein BDZ91DRAFT_163512 [Kalaharituber pfeilii]|nr:hypothetical protein BDZ91DRAFT_163512 [Kalaharituber pfeilii]
MGSLTNSESPKTPLLQPKVIPEEEDPVPDFYLDDDAGVGSPMDFDEESTSSLSTLLAYGAHSPSPSPAPSLVSDTSIVTEASMTSDSEPDEPRSTGMLKPPQDAPPFKLRKPLSTIEFKKMKDIGIIYGLGRAGSPRESLLHLQRQELNRRPVSPPTDTSDSEEEDNIFGGFKRRVRQHRQNLHKPLHPPPLWRISPDSLHKDRIPRVRSPGEMTYDDARFIIGHTSSLSPPPYSPPYSPSPIGGVYRAESNVRGSRPYNVYSYKQPAQPAATKIYSFWKDGEWGYEDQWGNRIYPGGSPPPDGSRFNLWPVKEDVNDEVVGGPGNTGSRMAIPGGRSSLNEQRMAQRNMMRF